VAFTPVESSCKEQFAAGWFVNQQTGCGTRPTAPSSAPTTTVTPSGRDPLQHARRGRSATPVDPGFLTDQIGRRDVGRQDLPPTGRTRGAISDTARAMHLLLRRQQRLAVGDGSLFLTTRTAASWTPRTSASRRPTCGGPLRVLTLCVMTDVAAAVRPTTAARR
jgi:hypothetical protein